jgi:uncharacterized membrane protein
MNIISLALVAIGSLMALGGFIMILIEAFKKSVMWGIGCLICGIATLIFVFTNWDACKKGFLILLAGVVLEMIGMFLGGASAFMQKPPM